LDFKNILLFSVAGHPGDTKKNTEKFPDTRKKNGGKNYF
jgi:hypothetical protein